MAPRVVELHRTRARTLVEMGRALSAYARDPAEYERGGLKKHARPETPRQLERLAKRFEELPEWSAAATEAALRETAEAEQIPAGKLIHPVRLALTGSPWARRSSTSWSCWGGKTALRRLEKFVAVLAARAEADAAPTA